MKFAIPLVVVALLAVAGALALGLNDDRSPTVTSGDVDTDPAAALAALAETYRRLPSFRETLEESVDRAAGRHTSTMAVAVDADENVELVLPGSRFVITDTNLFMTLNLVPHKYVQADASGDPDATFRAVTGASISPVSLALRSAATPELQTAALVLDRVKSPRLQAVALVAGEDGTSQRRLTITGSNGNAEIYIDPVTGLLVRSVIEHEPAPGQKWKIRTDFSMAAQSAPISFDGTGRHRVPSLAALKQTAVGEPAPDLVLPSLDGQTVTLSDYRGSVVVLDFWATWCGPCRRALPMLNEFHVWAGKSGLPIKVLAVDVWERLPDPAANRKAVETFWRESGFLMPTLIDDTGNPTYPFGLGSIPTTMIIGPGGRIERIDKGYDPNMLEKLKTEVQAILESAS